MCHLQLDAGVVELDGDHQLLGVGVNSSHLPSRRGVEWVRRSARPFRPSPP